MDKEIHPRIGKASTAFGNLKHRLWSTKDLSLKIKINIYRAVVLSTLLYGTETWTFYRKHINQLDAFHMRCLRAICGIRWDDRVKHSTILKKM